MCRPKPNLPFAADPATDSDRGTMPSCCGDWTDRAGGCVHQRGLPASGEADSAGPEFEQSVYFSFTKSKTKIAHTPTVMGNCTKEASRIGPPLGRRYVAAIIARAVNTPRRNLLFQFMCSPALPVWDFENGSDCN